MSDTAAIIRLCYPRNDDDGTFEWRMSYFIEHVLPTLKAQTHPLDTWVWVHPRHAPQTAALARSHGFRTFSVDMTAPSTEFKNTIICGYAWDAVEGLPRYPFQVLLGSDDLLAPEFTAVSLERIREQPRSRRLLVTHYPIALDVDTGICYEMRRWPRPTPFMVLRQNIADADYTWVWAQAHNKFARLVDQVFYIEPGLAVMSIHGFNDGTRITSRMIQTPRPAWLDRPVVHA